MLNELILALIQSLTEFLPVSSDGHLALTSLIISTPNLFFTIFLHFASLLAVIIFLRKEIFDVLKFKDKTAWYVLIGIIPAGIFGFLFKDLIEKTSNSFLLIGLFFILNGFVLLSTKFVKITNETLNFKNSFIIGLFQVFALFPAISRSGMTISSASFLGINKEKAAKFSFLMFIPLTIGAFILELIEVFSGNLTLNIPFDVLLASFLLCFGLSLIFINFLFKIIKKDRFWMFSIYCFIIGLISLAIHFF